MSDDRPTRQELYDRIRGSSKDQVILEEMIRLGFYPKDGSLPDDPIAEIQRLGDLHGQLRKLRRDHADLHNLDKLKRQAKRARMDAALQRRKETKAKRLKARQDRAAAWVVRQSTELLHIGEGVSEGLGQTEGTPRYALPNLQDGAAIAAAMDIDVGELRWLAYNRRVSKVSHYKRFSIPKKTGGERLISAPMPRLKASQHWVLRNILDKVPLHDAAHGFVTGRSIVSNAAPHVNARIVVNMDLQDFFPSISWVRVRGLFASFGYSREAATVLALLCTEAKTTAIELDGETWHVAQGERVLPQGSPASPAITNALCWQLDRRLSGLCAKLGFVYTRYADDLTFSAKSDDAYVGTLLKAVGQIVEEEGFTVHPKKTRVMRAGSRQEVTGLVVNNGLSVSRPLRRNWKAALFRLERDGPDAVEFGHGNDVFASLIGFAEFVAMVTPKVGAPMVERARAAAAAHGWKARVRSVEPSTGWKEKQAASIAARIDRTAQAHAFLSGATAQPPEGAPTGPRPTSQTESAAASTEADSSESTPHEPAKWWEFWRWFE
ncbi:MAG: RNA-directed DNA polymerase [Proteobacteria bacterium]|nr:RNA-directed DNA polymerase [Pseudomonadota bacterium]